MPLLLLLILLSLTAPASAHLDASVSEMPRGTPLSPVTVTGLDGRRLPVPFKGAEVLLFWSIHDGEPLKAMAEAASWAAASHPKGLRVLAINLDSKVLNRDLPAKMRAKAAALSLNVPLALDSLRYSRDSFHLKKTPALVIVAQGQMDSTYAFTHSEDRPLFQSNLNRLFPSR